MAGERMPGERPPSLTRGIDDPSDRPDFGGLWPAKTARPKWPRDPLSNRTRNRRKLGGQDHRERRSPGFKPWTGPLPRDRGWSPEGWPGWGRNWQGPSNGNEIKSVAWAGPTKLAQTIPAGPARSARAHPFPRPSDTPPWDWGGTASRACRPAAGNWFYATRMGNRLGRNKGASGAPGCGGGCLFRFRPGPLGHCWPPAATDGASGVGKLDGLAPAAAATPAAFPLNRS